MFVAWAGVTGVHTLARLLPAMRIVTAPIRSEHRVPGTILRATVFVVTLLVAVIATIYLYGIATPWLTRGFDHR